IADDFGYVDSMAGIDEGLLFSGGDPLARTEHDARFTYFSSAKLQTRSVNGNLFITSGTAQTTAYFNPAGGATVSDPTSFKAGTAVAAYTSTWHDIVNVQSPNVGIATIEADERQTSATPFTLEGTQYVFGHVGLLTRLSFTGEGTRSEATLPRATILYGGQAPILAGTQAHPTTGPTASGSSSGGTGWAIAATLVAVAALAVALAAFIAVRRQRSGTDERG